MEWVGVRAKGMARVGNRVRVRVGDRVGYAGLRGRAEVMAE